MASDPLDGQRLEAVTGLLFDQAEQDWLQSVAAKNLEPLGCRIATVGKQFLQPFCEKLEGKEQ